MNRLKELESIRNTFDEALGKVEQQIEAEKIGLVQESLRGHQLIDDYHLAFGYCHECPKSPTGHCVYNDAVDICHDDCIYCDLPEDRG